MHFYSLVITRLLSACFGIMLNDPKRMSTAMKTSKQQTKRFRPVRRKVLSCLSELLNQTERNTPVFGPRVNFSEMCSDSLVSNFFSDFGIIGMLQSSNQDSPEQVLPFLGVIADTMCDDSNSVTLSRFSEVYSDLLLFINHVGQSPYWICEDIETLKSQPFKKLEEK